MSPDLLHVLRYGPQAPAELLLIHGVTGHGQRWQTLASQLPEVSILAPDLLGHGRSSWAAPWTLAANVDALAAQLDGPTLVVGHSFGGAVALTLAATYPELVSGLILLDPAVGLDGEWMREIAENMMASPDYPDVAQARVEKMKGSWGEVDAAELDRELGEHLTALPNGRYGWRVCMPAMMAYWSELARPVALPRTGTPTTLVRATKTSPPYATVGLINALTERLGPDFTLLDWDCNHMVAQARPAETAALIRERLG